MSVILGVMSVTQRFREPKQLGQTSEKFNVTEENFEHLPIKKNYMHLFPSNIS